MLEYREFPFRKAAYFALVSPTMAYFMYAITQLSNQALFPAFGGQNLQFLGIGLLSTVLTLLVAGFIVDYIGRGYVITTFAAIVPLFVGMYLVQTGTPSTSSPGLEMLFTVSVFSGMAVMLLSWVVQLGKAVVAKYRGRVIAAFMTFSLVLFAIYSALGSYGINLDASGIPVMEILAVGAVLLGLAFKPWRMEYKRFAVQGNALSYFIPVTILMAGHILWYFGTQLGIIKVLQDAGFSTYESLGQYSGLSLYEPIMMIVGIVVAGTIADRRGRKGAFTTGVLLFGLLTILSPIAVEAIQLYAAALLVSERFIEGFFLGLILLLIWPEIGSPRTKSRRTAAVWIFFAGYVALFWAVSLRVSFVINWYPPADLRVLGTQIAILLAMLALYRSAPIPEILGKEIEIEKLSLDFDERLVKQTVEQYVGSGEFESIKSQLDIMGMQELSDKDMHDIIGPDMEKVLPLRKIPGIGARMEERLREAGYESAQQLAGETPQRLSSKAKGLSVSQAEKILANVRDALKKAIKSKPQKGTERKRS
ncbi:MAG: hypothetical protein C4K47_04450 [Candidatus Thorarchaeota archaeon]|nr:MAG: hypothetical protein C4K47_04450 [Candidatus Thorarchaeota archaeon]